MATKQEVEFKAIAESRSTQALGYACAGALLAVGLLALAGGLVNWSMMWVAAGLTVSVLAVAVGALFRAVARVTLVIVAMAMPDSDAS